MLIGDITIASILQEELDELRGDQRAIADLFAQAPPEVQDKARRYFSNPDTTITIRQGFSGEAPKNAIIAVVLAGEQEDYTPIGGHVDEGFDPDINLAAMHVRYSGNNVGQVIIDKASNTIYSLVVVPGGIQPVGSEMFSYALGDYATIQLLADAINTQPLYTVSVSNLFSSRPPGDLQSGKYDFGILIPLLPSDWNDRSATFFRATWVISALSTNVNETLWLHAFIKWALLRRRIDLEFEGIMSAQLSGGDFEPASEWLKNWPNVFVRGVMLSGMYSAQYVERTPVTEIKYADVQLTVPPSYLE